MLLFVMQRRAKAKPGEKVELNALLPSFRDGCVCVCALGESDQDPIKGAISSVASAWSSMGLGGGDPWAELAVNVSRHLCL